MLTDIVDQFQVLKGSKVEPYGDGHIHKTYLVDTKYVLQELNNNVFPNIEKLMSNVEIVTRYLKSNNIKTLSIIPTKDNKSFYKSPEGKYYRMYDYVKNSCTYQVAKNDEMVKDVGFIFGDFINNLKELPQDKLYDTLPGYHITKNYWDNFKKHSEVDNELTHEAKAEIDYINEHEDFALNVVNILSEMPVRTVHQDTKINNVLFDKDTDKPICVIDIDTVGTHTSVYDFGDIIRFSANTAAEDEEDLSKVKFNDKVYELYEEGFIEGLKPNEEEKKYMFWGAKVMTFENAMRFLTDYFQGNVYFSVSKPKHNLIRARNQIKLLQEMEKYESI